MVRRMKIRRVLFCREIRHTPNGHAAFDALGIMDYIAVPIPGPVDFALGVWLDLEPDEANEENRYDFELFNTDGSRAVPLIQGRAGPNLVVPGLDVIAPRVHASRCQFDVPLPGKLRLDFVANLDRQPIAVIDVWQYASGGH